jgi:hypothetical protein
MFRRAPSGTPLARFLARGERVTGRSRLTARYAEAIRNGVPFRDTFSLSPSRIEEQQ